MKIFLGIILYCSVGFVAAVHPSEKYQEECQESVTNFCYPRADSLHCNSTLSGFKHAEGDLQAYVNVQLSTSYQYLLLSARFNNYQKNRPGFSKLFKDLSDKTFENSINLIKHISKRGGVADFYDQRQVVANNGQRPLVLEVDELESVALTLEAEKRLAHEAHHIHRRVSHLDAVEHYDPEISQFLEEEFLEYQTDTIRKLSGYANDLARLVKVPDSSLALYLFDEYLQKQ